MVSRQRIRDIETIKLFARNMRAIRQSQGLSMVNLSTLMQVEYVQVANLELGKRDPSLSMLKRVADALNTSISELLKES
jgi:transcriptional regulator with XRE-family HTH domain